MKIKEWLGVEALNTINFVEICRQVASAPRSPTIALTTPELRKIDSDVKRSLEGVRDVFLQLRLHVDLLELAVINNSTLTQDDAYEPRFVSIVSAYRKNEASATRVLESWDQAIKHLVYRFTKPLTT